MYFYPSTLVARGISFLRVNVRWVISINCIGIELVNKCEEDCGD